MAHPFVVKTDVFEGPLDLLLSLIEKNKLSINRVSLAKVADDYIARVKSIGDFQIADSASFILIASTLLLIKSKSLLPSLALSEEEQGSIEDLEKRLKIYERMKGLSVHIKRMFGQQLMFGTLGQEIRPVFAPHESISVSTLHKAIKEMLKSLPKSEFIPKVVVDKVISLEEMIQSLAERVGRQLKMSFSEFAGVGKAKKVEIIVGFLAMLELVKQGAIRVTQDSHFSDITMETESLGVPKYGK